MTPKYVDSCIWLQFTEYNEGSPYLAKTLPHRLHTI